LAVEAEALAAVLAVVLGAATALRSAVAWVQGAWGKRLDEAKERACMPPVSKAIEFEKEEREWGDNKTEKTR
jgi:hypothetical protein